MIYDFHAKPYYSTYFDRKAFIFGTDKQIKFAEKIRNTMIAAAYIKADDRAIPISQRPEFEGFMAWVTRHKESEWYINHYMKDGRKAICIGELFKEFKEEIAKFEIN